MAVNRIIVEDAIYDDFATRFVERVRDLRLGDPKDPATAIGPVINTKQFSGLLTKVEQARNEGALLAYAGDSKGLVFAPHVFVRSSRIWNSLMRRSLGRLPG